MQTQSYHITINEDQPNTQPYTVVFCLHMSDRKGFGRGAISTTKMLLKQHWNYQIVSMILSVDDILKIYTIDGRTQLINIA